MCKNETSTSKCVFICKAILSKDNTHCYISYITGHQKIMIQTVGNDVVVFWLWLQHRFPSQKKNFSWHLAVADHEMSTRLGPENALALPVFHALTGCMQQCFKLCWTWEKNCMGCVGGFPGTYACLVRIVFCPRWHSVGVMTTIEWFVILFYEQTSTVPGRSRMGSGAGIYTRTSL